MLPNHIRLPWLLEAVNEQGQTYARQLFVGSQNEAAERATYLAIEAARVDVRPL